MILWIPGGITGISFLLLCVMNKICKQKSHFVPHFLKLRYKDMKNNLERTLIVKVQDPGSGKSLRCLLKLIKINNIIAYYN